MSTLQTEQHQRNNQIVKSSQINFTIQNIDDSATIEELDGGVYFGNVSSNGTVDLNNKNGNVLIVGSNFAKDLNVNSDRDIEISTSKAQNMNANGRDVTIHDLTADTLANNIVASRDALLEGTAVKFKSVNAGRDAELRGGQILTPPTGADINAARVATVATKTQNITLNKVEGKTLYTTFAPNNEVRITDGQKIVLETSGANSMVFAKTIDDTANNREFELRAGQFDYAPKTVALKTGIITLDGKRSDLNVKDGVSNADTIDINAFDSQNLNIKTSNGNVYVYHPITRSGITYEAKKTDHRCLSYLAW
jgi:hypothetical protein